MPTEKTLYKESKCIENMELHKELKYLPVFMRFFSDMPCFSGLENSMPVFLHASVSSLYAATIFLTRIFLCVYNFRVY